MKFAAVLFASLLTLSVLAEDPVRDVKIVTCEKVCSFSYDDALDAGNVHFDGKVSTVVTGQGFDADLCDLSADRQCNELISTFKIRFAPDFIHVRD
jgi:hypothetical protein